MLATVSEAMALKSRRRAEVLAVCNRLGVSTLKERHDTGIMLNPAWMWGDVLISASVDYPLGGGRWLHVALSRHDRMPDYHDLAAVRRLMFKPDASVILVLPPRPEHVNVHEFCLHLWQRLDERTIPDLRTIDNGMAQV